MFKMDTLFPNSLSTLEQLTEEVNKLYKSPSNNPKVEFPMDEFLDKEGNYIAQLAVVGIDEKDIKVTVKVQDGEKTLTIKVEGPELTDEQKKEVDGRVWLNKKIKRANHLEFTRTIPNNLDVSKSSKTVDKGLLSVFIPVREEDKPVTYEI